MYELKGVLVHAGIAQGGHYYSFIKERPNDSKSSTTASDSSTANASSSTDATASDSSSSTTSAAAAAAAAATGKWYRFDDEDVTVFDPGNGFVIVNCVTFYVHLFTLTLPFFNHGVPILCASLKRCTRMAA
jgi:Ubiquitin carboxyl-terminal hydrolase